MKKSHILFGFILLIVLWGSLKGQYLINARSLGMAGSDIAVTEGSEHIGGNPATLARRQNFNFELHLLSARVMLKNNSFSLQEYDRYFTTGDSLNSTDIDNLLSYIPASGLRADLEMGVKTFSIYSYPFSLSLYGIGNGFVNLPKSAFQIPFYGNKNADVYHLDNFDGEAWGAVVASFGIAIPMNELFGNNFDLFAVGVAPKYIKGIQYARVNSSSGQLLTTDEYVLADGQVEMIRSEGAQSFSADLGLLAEFNKKWTLSAHASNIAGSLNWNVNNEMKIFEFNSDSIRINDLDTLSIQDSDTSFSYESFTTQLPRVISFAAAYRPSRRFVITASYQQGLNKSLGNLRKPLFAAGAEYKFLGVLPFRIGYAVGGNNGQAMGLGTGIDLKYWQLNLGYMNHNFKWFRKSQSVELALTTQFRF
jgi:hypothetical protein